MAIDSPVTYSDWYWKNSVDASKQFADDTEAILSSHAARIINDFGFIEDLPDSLKSLFFDLQEPPSFGLAEVLARFTSEIADSSITSGVSPVLRSIGYAANKHFRSKKVSFQQAALLYQRKKITESFFEDCYGSEGYYELDAAVAYDSLKPYPSIPDLTLYSRYHGDTDNVWGTIQEFFDIDPIDFKIWEWLGRQRLTTLQVQALYKRGLITQSELYNKLAEIGWYDNDVFAIEELGWSIPNAMLLVQGNLMQQQPTDKILNDISIAEINPEYARTYLDAILTKPASQDLVAYHLRKDPELSGLESDLQRIGIHPHFTDVYKTLAYPIPPVADIITMAVREAFTPAIAEKFGQYEDYPPEFEEWAKKKGLSTEWSKRYWAAHWSLPSVNQGFDMLHRGVIDEDELNMLLRALDVMPFWRDKLSQIGYRVLSRVDIRRMYDRGVLDETEVLEAYLELGYNDRDAKRMSDFTIKQVLATQSKFTTTNIVSAYVKYMVNRSEATTLLEGIGVRSENIAFILTTAELKRDWQLTDDKIDAIHHLYRLKEYDADKTRSELLKLDLPAQRVDVLMEQWFIEVKDEAVRTWTTAQTLSFMKAELITKERGIRELQQIGYDTEHINIYVKANK